MVSPLCRYCLRRLDNPADRLSAECGDQDCWGCISQIEADGIGVPVEEYRLRPDYYLNGDPNRP